MTTEQILSRVENVVKTSRGWVANCPAHDDHTPSLSVSTGDDGRTLLKCHAGCKTKDVVKAMGVSLSDLFVRPKIVLGRRSSVD